MPGKKSQKKTKYEDVLGTLGHSFKCNYDCHTKCYKNFTAVPVSQSTKPSTSTVSTRSKVLLNRATKILQVKYFTKSLHILCKMW